MINEENVEHIIELASLSSGLILKHYLKENLKIEIKEDQTPVTEADLEVSEFLSENLAKYFPKTQVITEENFGQFNERSTQHFIIDPLDGTKGFINRTGQFAISIGLIENNRPTFGLIMVPLTHMVYYNIPGKGLAVRRDLESGDQQIIPPRRLMNELTKVNVTASSTRHASKTSNFIRRIEPTETIYMSSAIKFCLLLDGSADLYPSFGNTMEWDSAGGHAILKEIGGNIYNEQGDELAYGKENYQNPHFIATIDSSIHNLLFNPETGFNILQD